MASISTDKQGNKTIQFKGLDGKRKSIRLGKARQRTVDTVKTHIEELLEARTRGRSPYDETTAWVSRICETAANLYDKLAKHSLVPKRCVPKQMALAAFLDGYISKQSDKKRSTIVCLTQCRNDLVEFFGAERALTEITEGDAEDWRQFLRTRKARPGRQKTPTARASQASMRDRNREPQPPKRLQENTIRRRVGRARLIARNPFAELKGVSVLANKSREHFVTRDVAAKVLKACPDTQWQLIFVLARYGGLRTPSETLALRWTDIDWVTSRITVHSPKTEQHGDGHAYRVIPLFLELRPYLEAARDEVNPGVEAPLSDPVITRYRDSNCNLRTQLLRIVKRAGVKEWPKLFQNLRASRATELAAAHPGHVAADWLGHSTAIAIKHYWQTTEDDFARALQNPVQQPAGTERNEAQQLNSSVTNPLNCAPLRPISLESMAEAGVEPARGLPLNGF
jgi:integrase